MRAAILRQYGQTPEPGEFEDPAAAGGEVVEVEAAGLNPVDIAIASGTFHGGSPPVPFVVGKEGVGRTGAGELVYFDTPVAPFGSFAERALIDPGATIALPADADPMTAVCFGIAGLAPWLALERRAQLKAGESVLVLAASGAVGQIAVQAARLLGAARVVAAARSPEGLERAQALGADAVVPLGEATDLAQALKEAGGERGFDVVIDPLWGEPGAAAVEACAPNARVVALGQAAGTHSSISSAAVRGKSLSILGYTTLAVPQEAKRAAFGRMIEHASRGELTVDAERVALDEVPDAWRRQQGSPGRKLVVVP